MSSLNEEVEDTSKISSGVTYPAGGGGHGEAEGKGPPTYFKSNGFLAPFQTMVNTYGVPRYQEMTPVFFSVVTFPFLFYVFISILVVRWSPSHFRFMSSSPSSSSRMEFSNYRLKRYNRLVSYNRRWWSYKWWSFRECRVFSYRHHWWWESYFVLS